MIAVSPKATVPVMVLPDDRVLEESLDIMRFALNKSDPEGWLQPQYGSQDEMWSLIEKNDAGFKFHLDRYKYANRYEGADANEHRDAGCEFLHLLNEYLEQHTFLRGDSMSLADVAIMPFVRQFANTDREWFDAQSLPWLQRWLNKLLAGQLFATVMIKFKPWQPDDPVIFFPRFS